MFNHDSQRFNHDNQRFNHDSQRFFRRYVYLLLIY
jgi:hypothetical protein